MKFPIVFRIYAVLNLFACFGFGILSAFLTFDAPTFGPALIAIHWMSTLWLLVASIAWFFASKHSYHFLFSQSLLLIAISLSWLWFVFIPGKVHSESDAIAFLGISAVSFLYVIFLLVAAFYKPVRHWTPSRFSIGHQFIFILLSIITIAGLYGFDRITRESISLGVNFAYDTNAEHDGVPESILGNQWIKIEMDAYATINTLSIPIDETNKSRLLTFVKIFYSDAQNFDHRTAPNFVAEFKVKDAMLVAEFPTVWARSLQLFPLENESTYSAATETFQVAGLTPGWSYGFFDQRYPEIQYDEAVPAEYADYDEGEMDAYVEKGTPEGNGRVLSNENLPHLYTAFLQNSSFYNSTWMFDDAGEKIYFTGDQGPRSFGAYTQGVGNLWFCFGSAVREFREYSEYDFEKYIGDLSGSPVYVSRARNYNSAGNGTKFNYLNPEIITWAEKNLLLAPDTKILGNEVRAYYNIVFKRFARMMVSGHQYLEQIGVDAELQAYEEASIDEDFFGADYLLSRYPQLQFDNYTGVSSWKDGSDFVGFWLRRKKDGTYEQCWEALTRLMNTYDKEWFEEMEQLRKENRLETEGDM